MALCFDLDGTLGFFSGGYVLLRQALGDLWGREPRAEDLALCKGSTDWEIVEQLHRMRFGGPLAPEAYDRYGQACLARFQAAFHPEGQRPAIHQGIVQGLTRLLEAGHRVWLVSGNAPPVLDFKAGLLGVDPRIPRLGSLPGLDRAGLLRRAMEGCPGPHVYVGDRPHDQQAALAAGMAFLGVGDLVPGDHRSLSIQAEAALLVEAVEDLFPGNR
jgi:phosphoglycolate phosphatase-like HAD superfamily hydrolase